MLAYPAKRQGWPGSGSRTPYADQSGGLPRYVLIGTDMMGRLLVGQVSKVGPRGTGAGFGALRVRRRQLQRYMRPALDRIEGMTTTTRG